MMDTKLQFKIKKTNLETVVKRALSELEFYKENDISLFNFLIC